MATIKVITNVPQGTRARAQALIDAFEELNIEAHWDDDSNSSSAKMVVPEYSPDNASGMLGISILDNGEFVLIDINDSYPVGMNAGYAAAEWVRITDERRRPAKKEKFTWGRVIRKFAYDFDGKTLNVVKYHPWRATTGGSILVDEPDESVVNYHVEEMHASFNDMESALIHWMVYKHLGPNQQALAMGLCRALEIKEW